MVGPGEGDDLPETDGHVQPNEGGASVSPSPETLPTHRVPRRLRDKYPERFPDARGTNTLHCWAMGEGAFVAGPLTDLLVLRLDPDLPNHGFVEPALRMPTEQYQEALAVTRPSWVRWEE